MESLICGPISSAFDIEVVSC